MASCNNNKISLTKTTKKEVLSALSSLCREWPIYGTISRSIEMGCNGVFNCDCCCPFTAKRLRIKFFRCDSDCYDIWQYFYGTNEIPNEGDGKLRDIYKLVVEYELEKEIEKVLIDNKE